MGLVFVHKIARKMVVFVVLTVLGCCIDYSALSCGLCLLNVLWSQHWVCGSLF